MQTMPATSQLPGGGELTLAAMDEYERWDIGRRTYRFCKSVMRDPELRARVKARAEEIRAEEKRKKEAETCG